MTSFTLSYTGYFSTYLLFPIGLKELRGKGLYLICHLILTHFDTFNFVERIHETVFCLGWGEETLSFT